MQTELAASRGPVEADARTEIVGVLVTVAVQEREQDRIDLIVMSDIIYVGVELVSEPQV